MALELETGRPQWELTGDGPGYTSPVAVTIAGATQIVTQTDARIVSVSLAEGDLLWSIPFKTPYDQNIFTTIRHGDRLIFGGLDNSTFALEIRHENGAFEVEEAWKNSASFYMSTPVLAGERLLGFSDRKRGQFVALSASTGKAIWESAGRQADNAAAVLLGDWLLFLTDGAELLVLRADAESFAPERTYSVADTPTWAHPVPTSEGILIKDLEHLTLWEMTP